MKRTFLFIIGCFLIFLSYSRDMVITKLNQSPIMIGNRSLKVGDTFSDTDVISWSSKKQDMKAKPKSGGLPRHYSAAAFKSKSQHNISIQQYLKYLNKTNKPSTQDIGDLYLQKSEKSDKYPEKRIALVIGNSIYGLLGRDLDCPISDAEDVTSTLNELGFDSYTLYDATNVDFHSALMKFSNVASAEGYDVALFYYCGHGSQNDGKNYLLPCDAKNDSPEDLSTWISFDAVFESLSETGCKTKLAFLDACRNAPRWQSQDKASRLDQYDTMGSLVVYSTANNMEALGEQEEESRNTPFGAAFLESVLKPSENISLTIKSISESVRERTEYYTKYGESPRQVYTFGVGDVDFSFVKGVNLEALFQRTNSDLSKNNPEMAIADLCIIRDNYNYLDSIQQQEFNSLILDTNEKLLCSNSYLVSIEDTKIIPKVDIFQILIEKGIRFRKIPTLRWPEDSIYTIKYKPSSRFVDFNTPFISDFVINQSHSDLVFYDRDEDLMNLIDLDRNVTVSSFEDMPFSSIGTYPLALNNNADKLIYQGGGKYEESVWLLNYKDNSRLDLNTTTQYDYYNHFTLASFSPNDSLFFISDNSSIIVYDSYTANIIHTFSYSLCDTIFWDGNNNLCISFQDHLYRWKIKENSFMKIKKLSQKLVDLAISDDLQKIGALCRNGDLLVFDKSFNQIKSTKVSIIEPDVISFSPDSKSLWILSGYYKILCIDLNTLQSVILYDGYKHNAYGNDCYDINADDYIIATWPSYIYMTPDNKYCITYFYYGFDNLKIFSIPTKSEIELDMSLLSEYYQRDIVYDGRLLDEDIDFMFNRIFVERDYTFEEQIVELSIKKISRDKSTIVEGYTDGTIKVFSSNLPSRFLELMKPNEGV